MHGVDFGEMTAQGPPGAHLYPADGLHRARGLSQCRVARGLPTILFYQQRREGEREKSENIIAYSNTQVS